MMADSCLPPVCPPGLAHATAAPDLPAALRSDNVAQTCLQTPACCAAVPETPPGCCELLNGQWLLCACIGSTEGRRHVIANLWGVRLTRAQTMSDSDLLKGFKVAFVLMKLFLQFCLMVPDDLDNFIDRAVPLTAT